MVLENETSACFSALRHLAFWVQSPPGSSPCWGTATPAKEGRLACAKNKPAAILALQHGRSRTLAVAPTSCQSHGSLPPGLLSSPVAFLPVTGVCPDSAHTALEASPPLPSPGSAALSDSHFDS